MSDTQDKDPARISKVEIAAIIAAVLVPTALFAIVLTPGAVEFLALAVLRPGVLSVLSVIGAIGVAAVLILRIRSRMRRRKTKKTAADPNRAPSFWDFWRNPYS